MDDRETKPTTTKRLGRIPQMTDHSSRHEHLDPIHGQQRPERQDSLDVRFSRHEQSAVFSSMEECAARTQNQAVPPLKQLLMRRVCLTPEPSGGREDVRVSRDKYDLRTRSGPS